MRFMEKYALVVILGILWFGCLQYGATPSPPPVICTGEHEPVCGVDGITYDNRCLAKVSNASVAHPGECQAATPTPADSCQLYRNEQTGQVQCFGCAQGTCTTPELGFEPYELPPDYVGIPYACYPTPQGCALAQ